MLSFESEFKIELENIYVSFFSYYVITKWKFAVTCHNFAFKPLIASG